ncbi:MAG TPA: thiamine phosphate synthase [Candidatus Rubrimentiphilum sp.]|nr:thiamine phosphate synthase [Candidatus Rubrimentiphilum sp.]
MRGIYAILNEERGILELARAILDGGVRIVQYRAKSGVVKEHASDLRLLTRSRNALFIINDDWRAVQSFDADGVHLGPDDASVEQIATIRTNLVDRLIGLSCGTAEEAQAAQAAGADYAGVGSVFATGSKSDAGAPIGIEGLKRVAAATTLPVAAIGGINLQNLPAVRATGVAMAAMISAFSSAADPAAAAAELVRIWESAP